MSFLFRLEGDYYGDQAAKLVRNESASSCSHYSEYSAPFLNADEKYEGEQKNGVPHGFGKLTNAHDEVYEGEFQNGEFHGFGKLTKPCGEVYEGNWKQGVISGQGKYTLANGDFKEGTWL